MTNFQKIFIGIILIISSNLFGHFVGIFSIFLTPIVVGTITYLFLSLDYKLIYNIFLIVFAIITNDILIKLFAGGSHDSEGEGLISAFFLLGLIVSTAISIIKISLDRKHKLIHRIIIIPLLPALALCYLSYFNIFSLSYSEQGSETKSHSIKNGTFMSDLIFSDKIIKYENDTVTILYGWSEKQRKINQHNIFNKNEETGNLNYTIKISHNLKPLDISVNYKVKSDDVNGSRPVDSIIQFTTSKLDTDIYIAFFKLRGPDRNDTLVKRIQIKR